MIAFVNDLRYDNERELTELNADVTINSDGGVMDVLPNIDKAVIPADKFLQYVLDPNKKPNKAFAFREALGYTKQNADELINNIRANINNFPVVQKGHNSHGTLYDCIMNIRMLTANTPGY